MKDLNRLTNWNPRNLFSPIFYRRILAPKIHQCNRHISESTRVKSVSFSWSSNLTLQYNSDYANDNKLRLLKRFYSHQAIFLSNLDYACIVKGYYSFSTHADHKLLCEFYINIFKQCNCCFYSNQSIGQQYLIFTLWHWRLTI